MNNKPNGVLYIGVINNLDELVKEHKLKVYPISFSVRYNCDRLVYFEEHDDGLKAVTREKQFKKWKLTRKMDLIEEMNSNWNLDLTKGRDNN